MGFTYWALVAADLVMALSLLVKSGLLWSIPRFLGGTLVWTGMWALAAAIRNKFLAGYPKWDPGNYVFDPLWDLTSMLLDAAQVVWDGRQAGLVTAVFSAFPLPSRWSGWNWPSGASDLLHLGASLFFALVLASDDEDNAKQSEGKKERAGRSEADEGSSPEPSPEPSPQRTDEPNRSASLGPIDYRALVDPGSVRSVAVQIASPYPHTDAGALLRAAALFEYVKKHVNYVPDPIRMESGVTISGDYAAHPAETLRIGGGDCDDQALLMASLLSAVGIPNRMMLVGNTSNEYHLLTEFSVDSSIGDDIDSILESFYQTCGRPAGGRAYWRFQDGRRLWLHADTTRHYISDYNSLMSSGFITKDTSGEIRWHNCRGVY